MNQDDRLLREKAFHNKRFDQPSKRSKKVQKFYSITGDIFDRFHQCLRNSSKDARVLECGCGLGQSIFALDQDVNEVIGIDISEIALKQAVKRRGSERIHSQFSLMDAHSLGFASDSFDLIYGTGILHHLRIDDMIKELGRVLAPAGKAVFIEPLGQNPLLNIYRALTPNIRSSDEHPLTVSELYLLSSYFDKVGLDYYYLTSLGAVPFQKFPGGRVLLKFLMYVDQHLLELPLLQPYAWMVFIELDAPIKSKGM
jgi:ubiquinone/menaquinone biosynthesis C-methylase UbiE